MAERRVGDLNAQELANTAWAFATADQSDQLVFAALARAAEWRVGEFNAQELANTAWAFLTVGELTIVLLDPISVLDAMEARGAKPQVMYNQMLMHGFATTSQIEAGYALLARAEASGLLCHSSELCYPMCCTLLEACHMISDSDGASCMQAVVERLGLIALVPVVMVPVWEEDYSDHPTNSNYPHTATRPNLAVLTGQINKAATIAALLCMHCACEILNHLNHIHLSACWNSLGRLAKRGRAKRCWL